MAYYFFCAKLVRFGSREQILRSSRSKRASESESKIKVRVIIEPDEGTFHAYCSELKGVHVSGDSEPEAFENCCIAINQHIRTILKHGDSIPIGCMDGRG